MKYITALLLGIFSTFSLGTGVFANNDGVYSLTVLPSDGYDRTFARDINETEVVVGTGITTSGIFRALRWDKEGVHDLGILEEENPDARFNYSEALGVNNAGVTVGSSRKQVGYRAYANRAVKWTDDGIEELSVEEFGSQSTSGANDINNKGSVVGYAATNEAPYYGRHATLWTPENTRVDLGTLGGIESFAKAINDRGEIVGYSRLADNSRHAFLWKNGVMHDLGTLGGNNSVAYDINNSGEIIGTSVNSDGKNRTFLWKDGVMTDLGTQSEAEWSTSEARAINLKGEIIGFSTQPTLPYLYQNDEYSDDIFEVPDGYIYEFKNLNTKGNIIGIISTNTNDDKAVIWKK